MNEMKKIPIGLSLFSAMEKEGDVLRREMTKRGTFVINLMSSPGSGKTSLLLALLPLLKERHHIGVLEFDLSNDIDAKRIEEKTSVPSYQFYTDGYCYLDSERSKEALDTVKDKKFDMVFLENIGNLVCPARFDTGAHLNVLLFSLSEGETKIQEYPPIVEISDLVLISKTDTKDYFPYDLRKAEADVHSLNPNALFIPFSSKTKDNVGKIAETIEERYCDWRKKNA